MDRVMDIDEYIGTDINVDMNRELKLGMTRSRTQT
jgi:hypothetical protein